jgi:DNA-binding IclR family transcriptional regulator
MARGEASEARYRVAAVAQAAALLRQFTRARRQIAATALGEAVGLSPALTRRTLATLAQHGLVEPAEAPGCWRLGLAWLRFAEIGRHQLDLRQLALPIMRGIRDAVDETVILALRSGARRVNVDYVESRQAIRRVTQPGFEAPLHIGAAGRALLSGFSQAELAAYFESETLSSFDGRQPIAAERLAKEIAEVLRLGYATAVAEITRDTAAVAAPVRDHQGAVIACLTLSCPVDRFSPALKQRCIRAVVEGAQELSQRIGHGPRRARRPERVAG